MIERVLAAKIAEYAPPDVQAQENVLAELMQSYVLVGLARAGFFKVAAFQGGTFLRIVHGLDRFSEDLDFTLKAPDPGFVWSVYLEPLKTSLAAEGLAFEIVDRQDTDTAVKKAFLKTDSVGNLLVVELPHARDRRRKIRIKLEVDTNPPEGSAFETSYLSFPVMTAITTQDLPSAFASKSHALLCRRYVKGRDWYDFLWYAARRVRPNLALLENAVEQLGPWAGLHVEVAAEWYVERLRDVIARIDWPGAAADVRRFLGPAAQESLELWSAGLFHHHLERVVAALRAE